MGPSRTLRSAALPLAIALALLAPPAAPAAKTVVASIGSTETGTAGATFSSPRGIAVNRNGAGGVPAGTFYVVDGGNDRIQQFDPAGDFVRTWGWGVRDGEAEFEVCGAAGTDAPVTKFVLRLKGGSQGLLVNSANLCAKPHRAIAHLLAHSGKRADLFPPVQASCRNRH